LQGALAIREDGLGPGHADTAASLQSLGEVTFDRGDFEGGQRLVERALSVRERVLGLEHPEAIESMNSSQIDKIKRT
jgi:hypothetical protein